MPKVTIAGGGLAGMTSALRLLERGFDVTIFESTGRLGGKAGANLTDGKRNDHGYHIFPSWYLNTWRLVDEIGVRDHFVDVDKLSQILAGQFPRFTTLDGITSVRNVFKNLGAGFIPIREMILFFYAALDLASQPWGKRASLDQISVTGFLRGKWYRTERLERQFHELMLKAITVPSYNVSSMTVKNVVQFWMRYPTPVVRILNNDLQNAYIEPLRRKLEALGCRIYLNQQLVCIVPTGRRVEHIRLRDTGTNFEREQEVQDFILAIPSHDFPKLLDDAMFTAAPRLANLLHLHSQPMVALDIYLSRNIIEMPKEHLNLTGARFGLSVIDVSKVWGGSERSILNAIASDAISLATLAPDLAIAVLLDELRRYIPLEDTDIERCVLQQHVNEPLFVNAVGAWPFRPDAITELENMYLAGDYCNTRVDIVSMESAISSGLKAAEAIRASRGLGTPIEVLEPTVHPEWLLRICKWALLPIVAAARWSPHAASDGQGSTSR